MAAQPQSNPSIARTPAKSLVNFSRTATRTAVAPASAGCERMERNCNIPSMASRFGRSNC
eukprot:2373524-Pleurochrysis_carterae.AAC.1